jgi:hypothetical protein
METAALPSNNDRRTGRTTGLLDAAVKDAARGVRVIFYVHHTGMVAYAVNLLRRHMPDGIKAVAKPRFHGVTAFEIGTGSLEIRVTRGFERDDYQIRGLNARVMYDHSCYR